MSCVAGQPYSSANCVTYLLACLLAHSLPTAQLLELSQITTQLQDTCWPGCSADVLTTALVSLRALQQNIQARPSANGRVWGGEATGRLGHGTARHGMPPQPDASCARLFIEGGGDAARQGVALLTLALLSYCGSAILTVQVLRAKESHAAAAASGRAHTVVQEGAEQTALRDN